MSRKIILFTFIFISFLSCKEHENTHVAELIAGVNQLKMDKNNEFLSTLKPSGKELRLIFKAGESVDQVIAYSNMKWADTSNIPPNSMKPLTEDADLNILSVSTSELNAGVTNGLPEEYLTLSGHLKDGVTLYAMQYVNEDGTEQKMRSAFIKVSGKWVIIPRAYKAFE